MTGAIASSGSEPHARKPRYGDRVTVTIDRLDRKGQGVGRIEWPPFGAFSARVRHAVPGSTWEVEVVRRRRDRLDAKRIECLDPGPHALPARCEHFGVCGGCSFQNLAYSQQLSELRAMVQRALAQAGFADESLVEPVVGMPDPFHYRNKMDFTFGTQRWVQADEPEGVATDFALGLHVPYRHDKVLDVHACSIAFQEAGPIVQSARRLAREQGLSAWDLKQHTGLLRHLVVRKGFASGQILAYLVTSEAAEQQVGPYVMALREAHPEITTLVQGVHSGRAQVAWGEWDHTWFGPGSIEESLLGATFEVQPKSFFQTNTEQAERLLEVVREEVRGGAPETDREQAASAAPQTIFDLYCGTGLLGLMVTPPGGQLVGIEVVASSVQDARRNAERLGFPQATFLEGDVREHMDLGAYPTPDWVILDPPRAGLHPKMPAAVDALGSSRILYVACNVHNAARDMAVLRDLGWRLVRARPVDLFPHTPHVECVFTLERDPALRGGAR